MRSVAPILECTDKSMYIHVHMLLYIQGNPLNIPLVNRPNVYYDTISGTNSSIRESSSERLNCEDSLPSGGWLSFEYSTFIMTLFTGIFWKSFY